MKHFFLLALIIIISSCEGNKNQVSPNKNQDQKFDAYKEAFVLRLWKMHPGWASSTGYHKYDSILVIPDADREKLEKIFAERELAKLEEFNPRKLSPANKIDFLLIDNLIKRSQWEISELQSSEWDPSGYNVCGGFAEMLANNYAPAEQRYMPLELS